MGSAQRHRSGNTVALYVVNAEFDQLFEYRFILDEFSDGFLAECMRHVDDGFHHRKINRIGEDVLDEETVDLDEVDRQTLQLGERRQTTSEIIQRKRTTVLAQALHERTGGRQVGNG